MRLGLYLVNHLRPTAIDAITSMVDVILTAIFAIGEKAVEAAEDEEDEL